MSLFKAREWWGTVVGEEEEFDLGCLCVANIDNNNKAQDKIIVGSFHGFLRIYNPRPSKMDNGWSGFKAEDVMVETQLKLPIVQVEAGRFMSGSEHLHLAILHPRKLAVYSVISSSGAVEHGSHYQLKLAYEHNLSRTAFNFCYGPFGGVKGRDFICVQSMDGTVSVFEQESFAFSRFLPGALLPGPVKYVPRTDSFVTVSSSWQVESYKYQVLAVATDAKTKEESQSIKSGKKVGHDWTFNLGEQALDLIVTNFSSAPPSIFILGERNFYCLSESGKLRFMKKFDYNPSCFLPYASMSEGTVNTMIGTHTSTLMVYQDITLKWASQLAGVPIQVKVANFQDLQGVIVTLTENGQLECSYMGTDPSMFTPPTAEVREIDYSEQDQEMQRLQKIIKEQQHKGVPMPQAKSEDDIQLSVQLPPNLDDHPQSHETEIKDSDVAIPSMTAKVIIKARMAVNDVKVTIHVNPPLHTSETLVTFPSVDPSRPAECRVVLYMRYPFLPSDLNVYITATYHNSTGAPRVAQTSTRLPLKLVVKPCLPVKNATFKLTIDTNKPPVNLNDIFPDLLGENAGGPGNALGFQVFGGPVLTVLASKTSQRYRLQCDVFEAMWLLLNDMAARLKGYFMSRKESDFRLGYDGALPLQEYFDVLDKHFECRQNDENFKELLAERASQFRAIQRRLLTRFKDKTPSPLQNLDTLMDGTYRQLLAVADATEENYREQERCAANLSCATRMLNMLIKLWSNMTDKEFAVLEAALAPSVQANGDQGWEEVVDAGITHLLRTCLAKSAKDQTVNPAPLAHLKETTKLKKHIALLCDRLSKGARLIIDGMDAGERQSRPKKSAAIEESPDANLEEAEVPLGSKFGEKSPRSRDKDLPPLSAPAPQKGSALPPLKAGGNHMMRREKQPENNGVPDLGELETPDDTLVNGGNEMVYGL